MADEPVVLFDLNVILDVLQKREPFYDASAQLLAFAERGRINGYVAAHNMTTLYYLLEKDKSSGEARAVITTLLQFLQIAPVDQATIEQALGLDYQDFEDAVTMIAAVLCKAEMLLTRNDKDFSPALIPVIKPVDFLGTF